MKKTLSIPYRPVQWLPVKKSRLLTVLLLLLFFARVSAQSDRETVSEPQDTAGNEYIHIRYADELNYLVTEKDTIQTLIGHVELNQDTVFIFCDSATIFNNTDMVAKGNFILQQGDSTTIFSDSAEYSGQLKLADLYGNVSMLNGNQKLFTDKLRYDANTKIATYETGATLTDDTTYLKSVRGYFHAKTDDIYFKDSVVVVSPDFTLRSDTLKFNARTKIVTFLAPTLIIQDTARIYTESGFYDINKKKAIFNKNPQYVKNDQKAWAYRMHYDGNKQEVTLIGDAHFEDSVSTARADIIRYNEKTGVTELEGNAFFQDEDRTLTGDFVRYDSRNETYSTRGRAHIVDGEQILDADRVDYVKEREIGIAQGHVVFRDTLERMTVICEYAEHSKKRNFLKATGGIDAAGNPGRPLLIREIENDSLFISADTLLSFEPALQEKKTVLTDTTSLADRTRKKNDMIAPTGKSKQDTLTAATVQIIPDSTSVAVAVDRPSDSIAVALDSIVQSEAKSVKSEPVEPLLNAPDTLALTASVREMLPDTTGTRDTTLLADVSKRQPEKEEPVRVILAYNDVRIFKSDLQALCDSLSYSTQDSLFRLFTDPIIWSDTSQFTADHIKIQLAEERIDKIYLDENSFIVNSPDGNFFNQIKGRNSIAFFDSSELRTVRVTGNAESVYYALDEDDAYIGVNKTVCSEMKIIFGNNEVEGIVFYDHPKANQIPMKDADHESLKMEGFSWQTERRPNSVADLLRLKEKKPREMVVPVSGETEMPGQEKVPAEGAPEEKGSE